MARSTLTPQVITDSGLAAVYGAADTLGSQWANDGGEFLHVKNAGGAPINVTITTSGTLGGKAVADTVVAVPNGSDRFIGPFPSFVYNDANGMCLVDFSAVASVTVALLK